MKLKSLPPFQKYICYLIRDRNRDRKIVVVCSKDRRKTITFAKWLMMVKLGRKLEPNETVRRINKNLKEDRVKNLKIVKTNPYNKNKIGRIFILSRCLICGFPFYIEKSKTHFNSKYKSGVSCGPKCSIELMKKPNEERVKLKINQKIIKEFRYAAK